MKRKSGFTLVELLVVIGIIALLISILLPALGRVRWQANITACGARMHDMMNAIQMYANDNKNAIPPWPGDKGTIGSYNLIDPAFTSAINGQYQFSNVGSSDTAPMDFSNNKDDGAQLGRLWKTRYFKTSQLFYCPSQRNVDPKGVPRQRDFHNFYTYNPNFKYVDAGATIVQVWWKKLNRYGLASNNSSWKNCYYGTDMASAPPVWTRPILMDNVVEYTGTGDKGDVAHRMGKRRAYNLAYADGHVSSFVDSDYISRPGTLNFPRFVNFTNAIGAAAAGLDITNWTNQTTSPYYAVPIMPN